MIRFVNLPDTEELIAKVRAGAGSPVDIIEVMDRVEGMMDEINQLRAFRAGSYKSAKEILAASMNIGDDQSEETYKLALAEIDAIDANIQKFHEGTLTEVDILNERLTRRYDPAMAWNEAINRAIASKKVDKALMLTDLQERALAVQQTITRRALKNA